MQLCSLAQIFICLQKSSPKTYSVNKSSLKCTESVWLLENNLKLSGDARNRKHCKLSFNFKPRPRETYTASVPIF